jgi:hypothetical protein
MMRGFPHKMFRLFGWLYLVLILLICWDNGEIYVHQVYAFVAPKIIGGKNAPSPVGDLGMVEMSQALNLIDVCYQQVSSNLFGFPFQVLILF